MLASTKVVTSLLTLVLVLTSCSSVQPLALSSDVSITLQRIFCPDDLCPAYEITIKDVGTINFKGIGSHTLPITETVNTTITKEKIKELLIAFDQAQFFSLGNYECGSFSGECPTDSLLSIIAITANGQTKTVRHYLPDKAAPPALAALECKIDETASTQQQATVAIPGCN